MAKITKFRLPVKSGNTIQMQEFDLPSSSPETLGFGYGVCSTAYITPEKEVTLSGYELTIGGIICVLFNNAVPSSASMNVNGTGAKPIYHRGSAIKNNVILQGDLAMFVYSGNTFNLLTIDSIPTDKNRLTFDNSTS